MYSKHKLETEFTHAPGGGGVGGSVGNCMDLFFTKNQYFDVI